MTSKAPSTPAIQVLERMFMLLDVLAAHPDPVALKDISLRQAATAWACVCWSWGTW